MSFLLNPYIFASSVPPVDPCSVAYSTDFESETLDALPAGWTQRWSTAFGTNGSWRTVTGRWLRMISNNTNAERACEVPNSAGVADGKLRFKARFSSASNTGKTLAVARASGSVGSETGYSFRLERTANGTDANQARIVRANGGSFTQLAITTVALSPNVWYWHLIECVGAVVRAKIWADGDAEPGSWLMEVTDGSPISSGWWGPGARGMSMTSEYDDLTFTDCDGP